MKLGWAVFAVALLSACGASGPSSSRPATPAPVLLARLGSLLPATPRRSGCMLSVLRGDDLLLFQRQAGAPAEVQRTDGRHILALKQSSGDLFGGFALNQQFEDAALNIRLALRPSRQAGHAKGTLSIDTSTGLTAILPVTARLTCYR